MEVLSIQLQRHNREWKMSDMSFKVFNELRLEGKLCDVVIIANGVAFNAHKNILCGCSPYFRTLFTSGWNSTEKRVFSIPGVSPQMMKLIIEYAYTGTLPITARNVEPLLEAADQFCVPGITQACCDFLESQLCPQNCIGIWKFTKFYFCPELQRHAYRFILHHFEEIGYTSEEFLELTPSQLCDIIEKDDLNVEQEEVVFDTILRWIAHAKATRKSFMSMLLPKVRMALMNADYFMNNVKKNSLVKDSEECKPIIIKALKAMYDLDMNGSSSPLLCNPLARQRLPYTILLCIGGCSTNGPSNAVEAFDARADRWVDVTLREGPRLAYHGTATLNGFVYCVGGYNNIDYMSSVHKFNPVTRTWHQVAPMHWRRCYVSVAILDGLIYAMGGFDGYMRHNSAERYEPERNQWTLIPPMHVQRSDASATSLHGKVYICGGFTGVDYLFSAEYYSPQTSTWTMIAPMRTRRSGLGVVAYEEQIYVVGGFDGVTRLRSTEAYNPLTDSWRSVSPMFNPRSNFGIEVVEDQLFVMAGFNGFTVIFHVECYDEREDKWYDVPDMNVARSALSCCVLSGLPNITQYIAPRDSQQGSMEEPMADAKSMIAA
ncbi:kelch-like protein 10 [Anguilla anguilla]|uniref:kelch-like protein 10 n=1 Tax=Anguilla anguilla TaxID=7936 RepID=UPI0015B18F97|nr:kelch-like protein 10 [Anguilla anguilla]